MYSVLLMFNVSLLAAEFPSVNTSCCRQQTLIRCLLVELCKNDRKKLGPRIIHVFPTENVPEYWCFPNRFVFCTPEFVSKSVALGRCEQK